MAMPQGASAYQPGVGGVTSYSPGQQMNQGLVNGPSPAPFHAEPLANLIAGHGPAAAALVQQMPGTGTPMHSAFLHALGFIHHAVQHLSQLPPQGPAPGSPGHPTIDQFTTGYNPAFLAPTADYNAFSDAINRDSGRGRMR